MKRYIILIALVLTLASLAYASSTFKLPPLPLDMNAGLAKTDEGYSPQSGKGYLETWAFWALGDDGSILIVQYLVSNTGLQNRFPGYNVTFVPPNEKPFSIFNEFDADTLVADKNSFNVKFPNAQAGGDFPTYRAKLNDPRIKYDLTFKATSPGAKMGGDSKIRFGKNHDDFFVRVILAPKAKVTGTLEYNGKTYNISGKGYVDHMIQNTFATSFSKRWYSFKFFSEKLTVLHTGFIPNKDYSDPYIGQSAIIKEGKIVHMSFGATITPSGAVKDSISSYTIPNNVTFGINEPGCKLEFNAKTGDFFERVNILSRVNKITAKLIGTFFSKPFIFRSLDKTTVKADFGNGEEPFPGEVIVQMTVLRK